MRIASIFMLWLLTAGAAAAFAQPAPPQQPTAAAEIDNRWSADLAAFDASDRVQPQPAGGVLFIGSSSIRLWDNLESQFSEQPVFIKRGLSGSRIDDCTHKLAPLVQRYRPRLVVFYAGDNDIAHGLSPKAVLASFQSFVARVRHSLAGTRIAYLSIKPSPLRHEFMSSIQQANALIRAWATTTDPKVDYIDIFTPMLGTDGRPRAELFRSDGLHLNDKGYALWKSVIADRIR